MIFALVDHPRVRVEERHGGWVAFAAADREHWEPASTPAQAVARLRVARPELFAAATVIERWTLDGSDTWLSRDGDPPVWWIQARGPRVVGAVEVVRADQLQGAVGALQAIKAKLDDQAALCQMPSGRLLDEIERLIADGLRAPLATSEIDGGKVRPPAPIGPMSLISYNGELVATVSTRNVFFTGPLSGINPADDPLGRFVYAMASYARDVDTGELVGPYSEADAQLYARAVLIADQEFVAHASETDAALAERFRVPLEQIALKRQDTGQNG